MRESSYGTAAAWGGLSSPWKGLGPLKTPSHFVMTDCNAEIYIFNNNVASSQGMPKLKELATLMAHTLHALRVAFI